MSCDPINVYFPKGEEERNDIVATHRANSDDDETDSKGKFQMRIGHEFANRTTSKPYSEKCFFP